MSLTDHGGRSRQTIIRQLAQQAAAHPRIESAVMGAIRAELPGVIEGLLRDAYAGEQLRLYVPRRGSHQSARERAERIRALAAPPTSLQPALIAEREGVSLRTVQRALAGAGG